jgi:hypothetical protein
VLHDLLPIRLPRSWIRLVWQPVIWNVVSDEAMSFLQIIRLAHRLKAILLLLLCALSALLSCMLKCLPARLHRAFGHRNSLRAHQSMVSTRYHVTSSSCTSTSAAGRVFPFDCLSLCPADDNDVLRRECIKC